MSQYPDAWAECEIGEISPVVGGGTPPSKDPRSFTIEGGTPWITPADLSGYRETYISRGARNLTEHGFANSSAKLLPKNALLFSSRAPVGYVAIAANPVCTNQGFKSFVLPDGFDPRYGYYYLRHIKPLAEARATGTTFKELSGGAAAQLPFLVAPLPEQKRIADKLEAVLGRLDACRARLDRVPDLLQRFRQSVLAAATSGRLTEDWRNAHSVEVMQDALDAAESSSKTRRGAANSAATVPDPLRFWECPDTWAKITAGQLLAKGILVDLKDGNHGSNHPKVSEFTPTGLAFITAAQVRNYRIDYEDAYKIEGEPLSKLRVGFAKADDVILTHKGSVGRVAVADRACILTPQTTYYRVNPEWIAPRYLMYFLASPPFGKQLDEIKSQTTRDFVPISQQYSLGHLIPSLSEQIEIVRRVDALFALADRIELRLAEAETAIDRLTPSTLTKAFRGELVPQDPNDEPASVLLERIRIALASEGATRLRKTRTTPPATPRVPKENSAMSKSRLDAEVKDKPYLAAILRGAAAPLDADALFQKSELSLVDFYKQLGREVEQGFIKNKREKLEAVA